MWLITSTISAVRWVPQKQGRCPGRPKQGRLEQPACLQRRLHTSTWPSCLWALQNCDFCPWGKGIIMCCIGVTIRASARASTNAVQVRRSCGSEGRGARGQGGEFIYLQKDKQNNDHSSALKTTKLTKIRSIHGWLRGRRAAWGGASGAYGVHRAGQGGSALRRAHPGKTATGCPRQTIVS